MAKMRDDAYQMHEQAKDVPRQQQRARTAVTKVDFLANLNIHTEPTAFLSLLGVEEADSGVYR